ncbi:MAG: hypothetical protein F6K24_02600 [Okeania sp. SIO2D1]|nr:hypothetical protein [Microcoleaceae cyanobacterium MO_207.B10]NES64221.1 hypothetical protein [Okeania sp. SIO2D1]
MQKVEYPLPPTLNKIINNARRSKYISSSEKRKWTEDIAILSSELTPCQDMVWLKFEWKVFNQKRDPDNIAAAAKFILDGLVAAEIIPDDSLKYIGSPILHYYGKAQRGDDSCTLSISPSPPKVDF